LITIDLSFLDYILLDLGNFCENLFTCLSLPSRIGGGGQQLAEKWSVEFHIK
jgi:hypothetical protein